MTVTTMKHLRNLPSDFRERIRGWDWQLAPFLYVPPLFKCPSYGPAVVYKGLLSTCRRVFFLGRRLWDCVESVCVRVVRVRVCYPHVGTYSSWEKTLGLCRISVCVRVVRVRVCYPHVGVYSSWGEDCIFSCRICVCECSVRVCYPHVGAYSSRGEDSETALCQLQGLQR